jgi:hypothetical protein
MLHAPRLTLLRSAVRRLMATVGEHHGRSLATGGMHDDL